MSTKNAVAANEGTSGNLGGDTFAQAANLANAMQNAAAGNANLTEADAGEQDADLTQSGDVDQTDNNSVGMNITF